MAPGRGAAAKDDLVQDIFPVLSRLGLPLGGGAHARHVRHANLIESLHLGQGKIRPDDFLTESLGDLFFAQRLDVEHGLGGRGVREAGLNEGRAAAGTDTMLAILSVFGCHVFDGFLPATGQHAQDDHGAEIFYEWEHG